VRLNKITRDIDYPISDMIEECERLAGMQFYSSIDGMSGYYVVPIREEDKEKTSFAFNRGKWQWVRMPFGIKQAPALYAKLLTETLQPVMCANDAGSQVSNFFDDTGVASSTWEHHLRRLRQIFMLFREARIYLNPKKCSFGYFEMEFCGHMVGSYGVKPLPGKAGKIQDWPHPEDTQREQGTGRARDSIRSFLGLLGFYRRFVKRFAHRAWPLQRLVNDKNPWAWTEVEEASWADMRAALQDCIPLTPPDPRAQLLLYTDASAFAVGATLMQTFGTKNDVTPIAFFSRQLANPEKNYATIERELLAIVVALKRLRHYCAGRKVALMTDHRPLIWLYEKSEMSGRQQRWRTSLMEYDIDLTYVKGGVGIHLLSDCMSRKPAAMGPEELPKHNDDEIEVFRLDKTDYQAYVQHQLAAVTFFLQHGTFPENVPAQQKRALRAKARRFLLREGKLARILADGRVVTVTPRDQQDAAIDWAHEQGHFGVDKVMQRLLTTCWWPRMFEDVRRRLAGCKPCQHFRMNRETVPLGTLVATEPWDLVALDLIGPLRMTVTGHKYILTLTCLYTKYIEGVPLPSAEASSILLALRREILPRFGTPRTMLSDGGPCFRHAEYVGSMQAMGVKVMYSPSYSPKSNPDERSNRTVIQTMQRLMVGHPADRWDEILQPALFAIRTAVHSTARVSPAQLMLGYQPRPTVPCPGLPSPSSDNVVLREVRPTDPALVELQQLRCEEDRSSSEFRRHARRHTYTKGEGVDGVTDPDSVSKNIKKGSLVMVLDNERLKDKSGNRKWEPRWIGPYRVVSRDSMFTWTVERMGSGGVAKRIMSRVHVDRLKLFVVRSGSQE
ncbi:MAG: RNase H-like domain-containing protein, partial [Chloroflexota bacterium]